MMQVIIFEKPTVTSSNCTIFKSQAYETQWKAGTSKCLVVFLISVLKDYLPVIIVTVPLLSSPDMFLCIAAMSDVEEEYEWVEQLPSLLIIWHDLLISV